MKVPALLRRNIIDLHGDAGKEWLEHLPELLQRCLAQWSLSLGRPYSGASYSYVTRVMASNGAPAVLKLSFPSQEALLEAAALYEFGGRGAVELFADEPSVAALLMARAEPGRPLARLGDKSATNVFANVARALYREAGSRPAFPWKSELERLSILVREDPPLRALAVDARAIATELTASDTRLYLLHGDLHQSNILQAGDEWVAIDPKGIIGERECEIAPFVLNGSSPGLARRMVQLCDELALDRPRAYAWTFVRSVLAILWCLEDHSDPPAKWIAAVQRLRSIQ